MRAARTDCFQYPTNLLLNQQQGYSYCHKKSLAHFEFWLRSVLVSYRMQSRETIIFPKQTIYFDWLKHSSDYFLFIFSLSFRR
jgi:hypothetical protein